MTVDIDKWVDISKVIFVLVFWIRGIFYFDPDRDPEFLVNGDQVPGFSAE
jgi:hypothetical protein